MDKDELHSKLCDLVKKAAESAERRWGGVLQADDIEQELWLFILESPRVQEYLTTSNPRAVMSALKRKSDSLCSKEQLDYGHFTGNFIYTPQYVKDLLKMKEEGKELEVEEEIDLGIALKYLARKNKTYHQYVHNYYFLGVRTPGDTQRRGRARAIEKLADIMNWTHRDRVKNHYDGPGTKNLSRKEFFYD